MKLEKTSNLVHMRMSAGCARVWESKSKSKVHESCLGHMISPVTSLVFESTVYCIKLVATRLSAEVSNLAVFLQVHLEREVPCLNTHGILGHRAISLLQALPDLFGPDV
jgi:hypothetical protein